MGFIFSFGFSRESYVSLAFLLVVALQFSTVEAADFFIGKTLYESNCADCHGEDGQGVMGGTPDFTRGAGLFKSDQAIIKHIREGSRRAPGFGHTLSEREMQDIVVYLRSLY